MDEKELETLWEEIRKVDKNMVGLFTGRVELTQQLSRHKMESNIPVYDEKQEGKNVEELSILLHKASNGPHFIKWYRLLTRIGKPVWKGLGQGDKK